MGPKPGGVGACPSFVLLKNLSSLHELEVLAALSDVGSLYNWVEHREELVLSKRQRFKAAGAGLYAWSRDSIGCSFHLFLQGDTVKGRGDAASTPHHHHHH